MRWYTVLFLGLLVGAYIVVGGIIFSSLESTNEQATQAQVQTGLDTFFSQNPCVNMSDVGTMLSLMTAMRNYGLSIDASGQLVNYTNWDIRTAMFVSLQLIATIGFNAAAPQSVGGRAFVIPFAIFGIPLFLVTAIGMGMLLNRLAEWLRAVFAAWCRCVCTPQCGDRVFRVFVITIFGVIFFLVIPSIIFAQIEPWTYADAFYFTFITLATIGFGDLIPSYNNVPWMTENYRNWYRLAIAFWILILSAWFAGVLVSIQTVILNTAVVTEDKLVKRAHGISSNNVRTNMNLGLNNNLKMSDQPMAMQYGDVSEQSHQYHGDVSGQYHTDVPSISQSHGSITSTPMRPVSSDDGGIATAHGVVTRVVV